MKKYDFEKISLTYPEMEDFVRNRRRYSPYDVSSDKRNTSKTFVI